MAYEYTIRIKKEVVKQGGNTQDDNKLNSNAPKVGDENNNSNLSWQATKALAVSQAKKYAQYALSNVGKYTGDSHLQTQVNNAIEVGSYAVGMATNPALTVANMAFNIIKTVIDHQYQEKTEQNNLTVARVRAGYTDTKSILTSGRH